jgi:hypothetical protein
VTRPARHRSLNDAGCPTGAARSGWFGRLTRQFIADAVRELSAEGIRQFLDIGTGLPTADNTHEVAQQLAPESRIVYAGNDPVVLAQVLRRLDADRARPGKP